MCYVLCVLCKCASQIAAWCRCVLRVVCCLLASRRRVLFVVGVCCLVSVV